LSFIAGVDRKTLATCPATDKMWAAHLGFSLCLSFSVVFGVTFHATGYMISDIWTRMLIALIIGMTVLMFDRALCQSDWFYQGTLWTAGKTVQSGEEARQSIWRFGRIAMRLGLSLGLAWVIAMFLELAIFSGTINEKIESNRVAANQPIYQKIGEYEAGLNAEVERRRASVTALEALLRNAVVEPTMSDSTAMARSAEIEEQIKGLAVREGDLRTDMLQIEQTIQRYIGDMNAEEFGQKLSPTNSGRPGAGPRYEYAKRQKEVYVAQLAAREGEIARLGTKHDELRTARAKIAAETVATSDLDRVLLQSKRDALQAQIDNARADLKSFEAGRTANVEDFRRKALAESYFQEKKDKVDPLTRMAAYQSLKNDPKDGATIALFSWMTRFFIIFLEIVPVVAKIFFSPPSVYAAKIQAEVERARRRIEAAEDEPIVEPMPERVAAPTPPRIEPIVAMTKPALKLVRTDMPDKIAPERFARTIAPEPETVDAPASAEVADAEVVVLNHERREVEPPAREAAPLTVAHAAKFSPDVENLMREAIETALPIKRQPASFFMSQHQSDDRLSLSYSLQYEIMPRG
jgi:hypothetical protein